MQLQNRAPLSQRPAAHHAARGATLRCHSHKPQSLLATVAASAAAGLLLAGSAVADSSAVENFNTKCMGCHYQGGNVVAAGATLFTADLEKNGASSPQAIYDLIYSGKAKMPGFGADCAPKGKCTFGPRLSDAEIQSLTDYVLERAAAEWK